MVRPLGRAAVNGAIGFAFLLLIGVKLLRESIKNVE